MNSYFLLKFYSKNSQYSPPYLFTIHFIKYPGIYWSCVRLLIHIPFFTKIYPIMHLRISDAWHINYIVVIGRTVIFVRIKQRGILTVHTKPESNKNVTSVLPPERMVK